MHILIKGFDWDDGNLKKLKKHSVSQEEAEEIFYSAPFLDEGAYEKKDETRYRCLGVTASGRRLAAFFTVRGGLIRNISVRAMSKQERKVYETKRKTA